MFKSFRLISSTKLSLFEDYSVLKGSKQSSPQENTELKSIIHSVLKRLKEKELAALFRALKSRGGCETICILFPTHEKLGKRQVVVEPQVVFYRVFRQPEVRSSSELKHVAPCSSCSGIGKQVCINPYHYSTVMDAGLGTTIYAALPDVLDSKRDESSGFISNFTQSTTCPSDSTTPSTRTHPLTKADNRSMADKGWPTPWCYIAYWEHSERIGPFYEGTTDTINVFESLPVPSGFCLASLNRRSNVPEGTKRVRQQIGYGLQLTREGDGIWVYNRSDYSLFANGPTLTNSDKRTGKATRHDILVHKIPPGYSLKVYDYNLAPFLCREVDSSGVRCSQPESIRISFKKGWGITSSAQYCRPVVTSCPCWIEIHFVSR